ncbi:hypothetical protein PINS_up000068 [Pythium insidiosum]|nr:hypothetical protein PINS_up000068 [Pythium insidiosum]
MVALARDGRVHVLSRETLEQLLTQALNSGADAESPSPRDEELRVKSLLQEIARVSSATDNRRQFHQRLDDQLRGLQSALQVLRVVQSDTVDKCFTCPVGASLVECGWNAKHKSIRLSVGPLTIQSARLATVVWDQWRLQVEVRADDAVYHAIHSLPVYHKIYPIQLCDPVSTYPLGIAALRDSANAQDAAIGTDWWVLWTRLASDTAIELAEPSDENSVGHASRLRCDVRLRLPRPVERKEGSDLVAAIMQTIMRSGDDDTRDWGVACRLHHGRWWVGMETPHGRLLVLRFSRALGGRDQQPSDDGEDDVVDIAVYATVVTDLLAVCSRVGACLLNTN